MALASEGDWESIASAGGLWSGHTNAQIACMFASRGLLDQLGDSTPILDEGKGIGRFGFSFQMT
jgi:hypothetical protein